MIFRIAGSSIADDADHPGSRIIISDNAFGRIFNTELPDNQNLTVESCVNSCNGQNLTVAGMEFGGELTRTSGCG